MVSMESKKAQARQLCVHQTLGCKGRETLESDEYKLCIYLEKHALLWISTDSLSFCEEGIFPPSE